MDELNYDSQTIDEESKSKLFVAFLHGQFVLWTYMYR
jgi:hypothetical protein